MEKEFKLSTKIFEIYGKAKLSEEKIFYILFARIPKKE